MLRCTLLLVLLGLIPAPSVSAQIGAWATYEQPGGGTIQLPKNWTMIRLSAAATSSPAGAGYFHYSQLLVNAKGTHNGVVCSVKAQRHWREGESGEIVIGDADKAAKVISALPDEMKKQGFEVEVLTGPTLTPVGHQSIWRCSLTFNGGASRLDVAYVQCGGFLHHVSAVYSRTEEVYWASRFDEILTRWRPGTERGLVTGEKRKPLTEEWVPVEASSGTIWLPREWSVLERDVVPEKLRIEDAILATQKVLNVRPNRYVEDTSVLHVVGMWIEDAASGGELTLTTQDARELADGMLEGIGEEVEWRELRAEEIFVAKQRLRIRTFAGGQGLGMRHKAAVIRAGNKVYVLLVGYAERDEAYWSGTVPKVLRKWELPPSRQRVPRGVGQVVQLIEQGDDLAWRINWTVLVVSFLVTWSIGLAPPLVVRFILLRRPIVSKWRARVLVFGLLVTNLVIFMALGSQSKTHAALFFVMLVSYYILRKGHERYGKDAGLLAQGAERQRELEQETLAKARQWGNGD